MKFSNVLVALDMTDHDQLLLKIAKYIADNLGGKRTYFAHVLPRMDFTTELKREINRLNEGEASITQQIQQRIQSEVENVFPMHDGKPTMVLIAPGKPYDQVSEWANTYDADLLIIGHKKQSEEYSMNAVRLARTLKSSVWFVPQGGKTSASNILVPIDFSENAMRALQTAIHWKNRDPKVVITPCFVYSRALDYYVYGEYYSWALDDDVHRYYKQYQEFLDRYAIDESQLEKMILIENDKLNIANAIQERARIGDFDLIMIGAKGHTALHSLVVGSVAEELLSEEKEIAVMLVR